MLDGPSTSLVDQLIIYSNSREVERIQAYDHIGYLKNDLGFRTNKNQKLFEGQTQRRPLIHDNLSLTTTH